MSRRYIADFVSKRERTKASAAFVGSSAMGMALGPLLARLFQSFPTMHLGPLTFNYITMGACARMTKACCDLTRQNKPQIYPSNANMRQVRKQTRDESMCATLQLLCYCCQPLLSGAITDARVSIGCTLPC